jgi:hypothetical protein
MKGMKRAKQPGTFTPMGGEQKSFDLDVLRALDAERALIQRLFAAAAAFDAVRQVWSFPCAAGDASKAPDGLFTVVCHVPRAGHRVEIHRLGQVVAGRRFDAVLFETDLPAASFEDACNVVHTVLLELAKGKEL